MGIWLEKDADKLVENIFRLDPRKVAHVCSLLVKLSRLPAKAIPRVTPLIIERCRQIDSEGFLGFLKNKDFIVVAHDLPDAQQKELVRDLRIVMSSHVEAQETDFYQPYPTIDMQKDFYLLCNKINLDTEAKAQAEPGEDIGTVIENIIQKGDVRAAIVKRHKRPALELLFVDDDRFVAQVFHDQVDQYHILSAENAAQCFTQYVAHAPNIVFLDIGLPDMDGMSIVQKLMAIDPEAFIVMLSANSQLANVQKAIDLGAKGFIAKPFSRQKVEEYVQKYLRTRQSVA